MVIKSAIFVRNLGTYLNLNTTLEPSTDLCVILAQYDIYRPQRSCGQGNVFTGVCLSPIPPRSGRPPQDQADTPQDQADTPRDQADTPQDQADTPPPEADSSIWSTSGRYASYWNAFLLNMSLSLLLWIG